jgi:pimeloyl-ACP methyl ester carboxylesterase
MHEPLLLLPGLLCDARLWRDILPPLAGLATPVIADLAADDAIGAMAERAVALMGTAPRFAVAGLSMGGYVAFEVARRWPERVSRLCLLDTSARPDTEEQSRRRRGLMSLAREGKFRGVTPRLLPQLLHEARLETPLAAEVIAMADRIGLAGFLRQQRAIMGRVDSRPSLSAIAVPTLVGVGEADVLTPPERAEEIAAGIPGARLEIFTGCGHLPTMEDPPAVAAAMRRWLTGP